MRQSGVSLIPPNAEYTDLGVATVLQFTLPAPPTGQVDLLLTAGAENATARVTMNFANGRRLDVVLPSEPVPVGMPVTIRASLKQGDGSVITGSDGAFAVSVTLPDESVQNLTLFDDGNHADGPAGDGVFGNVFAATGLGGRYVVDAQGKITSAGEVIERSGLGMFIVNSAPASFVSVDESAVDGDQDGKIDTLDFTCHVAVALPGRFQIMASLYDPAQEPVANAHVLFDAAAAPIEQVATLHFDAGEIVRHGTAGPYTLRDIKLLDNDQSLVVDTWPDHVTAAYGLAAFAPPPEPVLYRVSPMAGDVHGGNTVTLDGQNLLNVVAVYFGGQAVTAFQVVSDGALRVTVPPALGQQGAYADIVLLTPWQETTFAAAYRYSVVGDVNGSGAVDASDLAQFGLCMAGPGVLSPPAGLTAEQFGRADLDGDGDVDLADVQVLQGACRLTGHAQGGDLAAFVQCLVGPNATAPPPGVAAEQFAWADLDGDRDVDVVDFAWLQPWGN